MLNTDQYRGPSAFVLALGMAAAAFILGLFFYKAQTADNGISVVGNASKQFDTDIVKWQIRISRNARRSDLARGYTLLHDDVVGIVAQLTAASIPDSTVTLQPVVTNPVYGRDGPTDEYTLQQGITIISDNIAAIEELALNPTAITARGIVLEQSSLEYHYSRVDELKRELLGAATADAQLRAAEIAGSSGREIGSLLEARAGVFQITEPLSNQVSGMGMYDAGSRVKEIKVTVHAAFALR